MVSPQDGFLQGDTSYGSDSYDVTKRAGRKRDAGNANASSAGGKPQGKKAVFTSTDEKEVGVLDITLSSKISNEAINDNLKTRFEKAARRTHGYLCHQKWQPVDRSRLDRS